MLFRSKYLFTHISTIDSAGCVCVCVSTYVVQHSSAQNHMEETIAHLLIPDTSVSPHRHPSLLPALMLKCVDLFTLYWDHLSESGLEQGTANCVTE